MEYEAYLIVHDDEAPTNLRGEAMARNWDPSAYLIYAQTPDGGKPVVRHATYAEARVHAEAMSEEFDLPVIDRVHPPEAHPETDGVIVVMFFADNGFSSSTHGRITAKEWAGVAAMVDLPEMP